MQVLQCPSGSSLTDNCEILYTAQQAPVEHSGDLHVMPRVALVREDGSFSIEASGQRVSTLWLRETGSEQSTCTQLACDRQASTLVCSGFEANYTENSLDVIAPSISEPDCHSEPVIGVISLSSGALELHASP